MNTRPKRNIPWFWIFIFLGMFSEELFSLIIPLGIGLLVYYAIKSSREKNAAQNQAHTRAQQEFVRSSTTQSYKSSTQTAAKTSSSSAKTNQTGSYSAQAQKTSSTTSSKKTSSSKTTASNTYTSSVLADAGKKQRVASILWLIAGAFALFIGIILFSDAYWTEEFITAGLFSGAGLVGLFNGFRKRKRMKMNRRYAAVIGKREWMALEEIARAMPVTVEKAEKDLQALIDDGYFGTAAYIDSTRGVFYRSSDVAQIHENSRVKKGPVVKEAVNISDHASVIAEIRRLNDDIADPDVSARIDRVEELTDSIYKFIETHPEKKSQVTTFMDYYLPTTLKLLSAYAQFEDSASNGENVTAAKKNISSILDTLVDGFALQLDRLYETDVIDISGDIQVLEQMMARDGLSIGKGNIRSVRKGASASSSSNAAPAESPKLQTATSGSFSSGSSFSSGTAVATAPETDELEEPITLTLGK